MDDRQVDGAHHPEQRRHPPVAATLSLRGGNSLRLEGKPNFNIHLMTAEKLLPPVDGRQTEALKHLYLMNLKADPHHVKMAFAYRVLREIGLLSPRIRPRYDDVGLSRYFDGRAADTLSANDLLAAAGEDEPAYAS